MLETIQVHERSEIITSKAGRKYFTVKDEKGRNLLCFNPGIHYQFEVGHSVTCDIELREGKDPLIKDTVSGQKEQEHPEADWQPPPPKEPDFMTQGQRIRALALGAVAQMCTTQIEPKDLIATAKKLAKYIETGE